MNKVKIRVKTKYGVKKLPHYEDTIFKPHPVYTNIEGNKCGLLRYIAKEIGDPTKGKISFKFNGKKIHEKRAKLVWECYWCKKIKRNQLYIFDNYPYKDFDVRKIDNILKSAYNPNGHVCERFYWL